MTEDQKELRIERIAIMTVEGVPAEDAERYCDSKPQIFGYSEREEIQRDLI